MRGDAAGAVRVCRKPECPGPRKRGSWCRGRGRQWPEGSQVPLLLLTHRMDKVGDALEEVLSKALSQRTITVGVYEAAKLLNV